MNTDYIRVKDNKLVEGLDIVYSQEAINTIGTDHDEVQLAEREKMITLDELCQIDVLLYIKVMRAINEEGQSKMLKINDAQRDAFFADFFMGGVNSVSFEHFFYSICDQKLKDYNGGLWDIFIVKSKNGKDFAPLMVLNSDDKDAKATIYSEYSEIETDMLTASLALFSMALNHYLWNIYEKQDKQVLAAKLITYGEVLNEFGFSEEDNGIDHKALFDFLD